MLHTPEFISKLKRNEVFIFCSNTKGKYYGGVSGWVLMKLNLFFCKAVKNDV